MTVEALVETVPGADLRAVHLRENLLEGTKTESAGNAENALQTVQTRIAEETDTAATDIATIVTVTVIANDHREDTAAHDLGLAPHADHKLLRELYNGAALCHHNPTPLRANWCTESNTIQVQGGEGIVLKYHEPPEARKPPAKEAWRFYVFKGEDLLEVVELGERSCWLIGRENRVVDFPLEHPSCSKQHAALQFRYVEKRNEFGDRIGKVKPYLIDLESANGSHVNGEAIPAGRYVEVMDKDVIKFGLSTREYVLMLPS
ncbi:uncharacterized protein N7473_008139 [Penicillium subrubescens]|uniref:uncharacterized protein n=1 Tax=Penicillium subrubescens TaxID=1316194 RepID=UPI00254589E6|nr:uncharacterized protein N7473_008139 [Penicillium subrubescens]KAJ5891911.1 hypothetical protein N7473_008139 [Penicillium subrubescens]